MSRQMTSSHFHKSKTLDNKYMLGDEIGKGAYGRVYKGLDLENGDFVAIKQVSLENIAQEDLNIIMQEIDLLKNLNHKNIVKYLGSLKTRSHLHIILEYVENGSLANIIKPNKFGPFPEQLVAHYIAQVLEGLVYLHEQGVIHRDIKGANILTTKEGLVKLADFGVATKLTEADVNTHSVVGTPYWMAPEVIEMSGVCAASDIWSVGCTVIELLTCVPPYYDLQPMPALFRIVQDEHPPIPDGLSADMTDFLRLCFKKDARQRPDAKMLLSHPWIQNYRRTLQPSLPASDDVIRGSQEDALMEAELSNGDENGAAQSQSVDEVARRETLSKDDADASKANDNQGHSSNLSEERGEYSGNLSSDQVPTLAIHDKSVAESTLMISALTQGAGSEQLGEQGHKAGLDEVLRNGELGSPKSKRKDVVSGKVEGKGNAVHKMNTLFSFGTRNQDDNLQKAAKKGISTGNELSKFSDTPGDASLEDLFHPLDKNTDDQSSVTSASTSTANPSSAAPDSGKNDLATKLRAAIAQKQMENEMGQANGGNLLRVMIRALKEDVIDIDSSLVFDEKIPGENLFPLQAVEFSRLVASLRPEEPEDVIVNSCQKLITFFNQRSEQKVVFVKQHGLLPLMELLEVPRPRVICSVLQVINQIIKDNTDFQENACHVGLIPVVMGFAVPDRPREVRMEAAYFLQQLCQSSSLTLQMFIACRGIPVLVGFLEADYAKYREMVHLAIDGMWQVFKLQRSTPRNDFCRISAKNGILLRLINTLHSLNEATRLASISGGSGLTADGSNQRPRSGQLDPSHPTFSPIEAIQSGSDQVELRVRHSGTEHSSSTADADKPQSSHATVESSASSRSTDAADKFVNVVKEATRAEMDLKQQRASGSSHRNSTDRSPKSEGGSNGNLYPGSSQQEHVRPLLSLLEKEPPSRHFSGQLDVRQLAGMERHESILPLLHASNEKKGNGELDFLMAEFTEVSGRGKENGNSETPRLSNKTAIKKLTSVASNDGAASTSGIASQTASGVLSGSGVLNARPGSATSSGLLSHMVSAMNADVSREYLEKVAELLLEFAQADTTVKSYMCSQSLLTRLFHMFNRVEPPILLKLLKCINHLSTDPNCLENLQRAEAIKHLIPNLELKEGPLISQIYHEVLNALFNLCKINKRRQEQAAENGIIPHLMNFIMSDSPLKQYALPLLCDMAHASRNSREQLRAHGGLDVYLSLLDDELWSVTALDSIAVCLAHDNDNRKVEQALLKKDAVQKLVKFFQNCPEQHFVHILEPFLKIITKSPRINTTLAVNGLTPLLIAKLDHQDAIARLNLLKLIKAVYEHHPRPKQLIVENDLPQKLQNLIEERRDGQRSGGSGQVLVKQMATSLLKALHINTVL
ncbi:MAP3K epsilon protein kinase 1 isoform X2 [Beta vulgaris subsp. vulgaris]|uniref:MAP3K epsilon protein kinase 1 isoform X2 n=1 Tax=Beta vulgaris subsp. vulgaris TaxID=3555 RepID=UPI0020375730|nr:MAP3K epsilon protein kinase 1 isoform X2 [Beta vulgaris subsp. vulgaris]